MNIEEWRGLEAGLALHIEVDLVQSPKSQVRAHRQSFSFKQVKAEGKSHYLN
jgi:hypothetical protein